MKSLALFLALIFCSAAQAAPNWDIDGPASAIAFSGSHAGQPFKGTFESWKGTIVFDPAALEQSSVTILVSTASAKTGDAYRDGTLPQTEWLDAVHFPEAKFEAHHFTALGGDTYEAEGTLTLKDKTVPLKLPFLLKIANGFATMTGSVSLDRIALGIGTKSDPNAEWVSREIKVEIKMKARRRN